MGRLTLTAREQRKKKEQMTKIVITLLILCIATVISIWWVLNKDNNTQKNGIFDFTKGIESGEDLNSLKSGDGDGKMSNANKYANVEKNPIVTMEMEDGGIVKIELYPQIAPTTVENFVYLVSKKFYDGLTFHRIDPDFMAQGGDPSGDGTGGPGYSIFGEFGENGFKNDLKHDIGVISMARAEDYNTAGSQFFIVTSDQSYKSLDNLYAGFGKVIEGMDEVYKIVNSETYRKEYSDNVKKALSKGQIDSLELWRQYSEETVEKNKPINPPVIKKMTVETFGVKYDEPEKIAE